MWYSAFWFIAGLNGSYHYAFNSGTQQGDQIPTKWQKPFSNSDNVSCGIMDNVLLVSHHNFEHGFLSLNWKKQKYFKKLPNLLIVFVNENLH